MHSETVIPSPSTQQSLGVKIKNWLKNPGFQKYSQNTVWPLIVRMISLCISFIISSYVARYLGPYNYGQLSYAVSFVGIFTFVSSLGMDQVLYRDLIKFPELRTQYIGTAIRIKLFSGIVAAALIVVIAALTSPRDISLTLIFILSLTYVFNVWNLIAYEIQAHIEQRAVSIISLFVIIVLNILKVAVIFFNKGILYLSFVLLLEPVLYSLVYIWYRRKYYEPGGLWNFNPTIAKQLLHDSWPLMITTSFTLIYTRIDQVMIKHFLNSTSVGLYDAAVRIAEAWYFIPGIICSSFYPAIVNAKKISSDVYRKRILLLAFGLLLLAAFISLIVNIFAPFVIHIFYGAAYASSATVLQIYMWSSIWVSLGLVASYYLINENQKRLLFLSSLGAMILNLGLNVILIPKYGINGAALSTFFSYIVVALPILPLVLNKQKFS